MLMLDGLIVQCKIIMSMVSSDKYVNCQEMANRREMRVKEHTLQGFLPEAGDSSRMGDKEDNIVDQRVITLMRTWDTA
jgi:hypothetical protein